MLTLAGGAFPVSLWLARQAQRPSGAKQDEISILLPSTCFALADRFHRAVTR